MNEDLITSVRLKQPTEEIAQARPVIIKVGSKELTVEETTAALDEMKNKTSLGDDGMPIEAIEEDVDIFLKWLCSINVCRKAWENAVITVLHKKGDITKMESFRSVSLLSQSYKPFTKVITK